MNCSKNLLLSSLVFLCEMKTIETYCLPLLVLMLQGAAPSKPALIIIFPESQSIPWISYQFWREHRANFWLSILSSYVFGADVRICICPQLLLSLRKNGQEESSLLNLRRLRSSRPSLEAPSVQLGIPGSNSWTLPRPKKNPKAKESHEQYQRSFWTIRRGTGHYPIKQGFWGKSRPESSPESCRTSSLGYLFCPWLWKHPRNVPRANPGISLLGTSKSPLALENKDDFLP